MNQNKSLPIVIGIIVVILALVVVFAGRSEKTEEPSYESNEQVTNVTNENTNPTSAPSESVKPKPDPITVGTYTMATVATHNSVTSCWTVINDNVYDVTSWIAKHPGGKQAILGTCGKDASAYFNGQHGGQPQPVSTLATFKIGTLSK